MAAQVRGHYGAGTNELIPLFYAQLRLNMIG